MNLANLYVDYVIGDSNDDFVVTKYCKHDMCSVNINWSQVIPIDPNSRLIAIDPH